MHLPQRAENSGFFFYWKLPVQLKENKNKVALWRKQLSNDMNKDGKKMVLQSNCLIAFLVTSMCLDSLIVWVGSSVPGKRVLFWRTTTKLMKLLVDGTILSILLKELALIADKSHLFFYFLFFIFFFSPSVVGQIFRVGTNSFAVSS